MALSHRHDPVTSFEAAAEVEENGTATGQRAATFAAVVARPGKTSAELARYMGVERHIPARRLSELRRAGLVRVGIPVVCTVTRKRCVTWYPVHDVGSSSVPPDSTAGCHAN